MFATKVETQLYCLRRERVKMVSDVGIRTVGSEEHAKAVKIDRENA